MRLANKQKNKKHLRPVAEGMARLLSDTYLLMTKTHAFSWNLSHKEMPELSTHLKDQSRALWDAVSDMAFYVRKCGLYCPEATSEMRSLAAIREDHHLYDSHDMTMRLLIDNELMVKRCKEVLELAEDIGQEEVVNLIRQRIIFHKNWKSHLSGINIH